MNRFHGLKFYWKLSYNTSLKTHDQLSSVSGAKIRPKKLNFLDIPKMISGDFPNLLFLVILLAC